MFRPRNPPRFTETLYDDNILYDANIRYDGIVIIDPSWDARVAVTSSFTPRTGPQTLYTWGNANTTWGNTSITWSGSTVPTWNPRNPI